MSDSGPPPGASAFPPPGPPPATPGPPPGWSAPPPPPPGWVQPPAPGQVPPPQGWGPPPPGWGPPPGWAQPPGWPAGGPPHLRGAAHKPGAVPLRPLGLSDIYDAAFRIIRFNPRATVGASVLVAAVSMALPLVVTAVLTATSGAALDAGDDGSLAAADVAALVGTLGSFAIGTVLQWIGTLLVTGLIVHVCMAAAVGRRLSLGEAWSATHGSRWRLVGLSLAVGLVHVLPVAIYALLWVLVVLAGSTLVVVLWAVVSIPVFLALVVWLWIRVTYLAVPALMVERSGVVAAFGRGFRLTRRQFWRTFGIAVLTLLVTGIASQVLTAPIGIIASLALTGLGPDHALLGLVVTQAITTVIAAAFVTPFTAAVTSVQYLDQRMRKEAYDVELVQQAGVLAA